ncbi:alkaline phosphatase PafA [Sediminitomix flava]|uniref:Type I phosphodiesterase/nucleotide pyrophosphatase n=1 Tax=Sediminitomix flava TaxID=379075 RepID=A0A315ZIC5_SEDFL|nr:alkaline phosphatase PafA [Sediminitomix flava]PWJ44464.1 type I phosphodiesterase/nucleotide pyrophosphatase [Sediminitomix flava]
MKHIISILLVALVACTPKEQARNEKKPKLVLGIMVDQMRYDYISRFWDKYDDNGGFKRLVNQGYFLKNGHFNYAPTATGPGHASVYTGTTPSNHGIVGNYWFDRATDRSVYCVYDDSVATVGADSKNGKASPHRLQATTLSDELKLFSNKRSKVISISMKDRSAVLPAGFMADGSYWLDDKTGNWITSTFYRDSLPTWVEKINTAENREVDQLFNTPWETLLPIEEYTESHADDTPYESTFNGETTPTFPHDLQKAIAADRMSKVSQKKYGLLKGTPWGNTMVKSLAIQAIENENLGQDKFTDLLAISFSSTDYVGHAYGPASIEVEDTYLRLDQDLAELLNTLDQKVGKGEYVVFLTADHAAAYNSDHLKDEKINAGYYNSKELKGQLNDYLDQKYGKARSENRWVKSLYSGYVYLNREEIQNKRLDLHTVQQVVADYMIEKPTVKDALTAYQLRFNEYQTGYKKLYTNQMNPKNTADVILVHDAGYMEVRDKGTTHGSPFVYDTHVPIIFYGWNVKHGETHEYHTITEVAPTVASWLDMSYPSACFNNPVNVPLR